MATINSSSSSDSTSTIQALSAIRESSSSEFQNLVPKPTQDNIHEYGSAILDHETTMNEFVNSLVNRIGKVIVVQKIIKNPLAMFRKGKLEGGFSIEQVWTDIAQAQQYDPERAETDVYKRVIPNVKAIFFQLDKQLQFKQTISYEQLSNAFLSWNGVDNLVSQIVQSMYNSDEVTNFLLMKQLIKEYYDKRLFKFVKVDSPTPANANALVTKFRAYASRLTFPSRKYNAQGVVQTTPFNNQYLFLTSDVSAQVDVNTLASAFNMDKADFMGHRVLIDDFNDAGTSSEEQMIACIVDGDWFQIYDKYLTMAANWNGQGLYWNYFLHHWEVMAVSQFSNAVAFTTDTAIPQITQLIVNPRQETVKLGGSLDIGVMLREFDNDTDKKGAESSTTMSVAKPSSSPYDLSAGTTINGTVLTVDPSEKNNQVVVTATNNFDKKNPVTQTATITIK